jgi:hypothetical protein
VWLTRPGENKLVPAATVSAIIRAGSLSEPNLVLEPAYKDEPPPMWEKEKIKEFKALFVAAEKHIVK